MFDLSSVDLSSLGFSFLNRDPVLAATKGYSDQFGDGNSSEVESRLKEAKAKWTSHGWDIPNNIDLSGLELKRLPLIHSVRGDVDVSANKLTSLAGLPSEVFRHLWCFFNKLESLKEAPRSIGGSLYAFHNRISSLAGMPEFIGGDLWIYDNPLQKLVLLPKNVTVKGKVILIDTKGHHIRKY